MLLCISTLLESSNHYSRMFTLKTPTGQPLFETFQVSLICDKCLASDHPEKCTHRAAEVPRWISNAKMETIKTLLADDPVSKRLRQTQTRRTLTASSRCTGARRPQALLMRESMGIRCATFRAYRAKLALTPVPPSPQRRDYHARFLRAQRQSPHRAPTRIAAPSQVHLYVG